MAKEFEPDDPMEMIAIDLPCEDENQLKEMAVCFVEEFMRMGWKREEIIKIFKNPFYQGPFLVWKQKGDDFVNNVVEEVYKIWNPVRRQS